MRVLKDSPHNGGRPLFEVAEVRPGMRVLKVYIELGEQEQRINADV
jgi:hypothetical protein